MQWVLWDEPRSTWELVFNAFSSLLFTELQHSYSSRQIPSLQWWSHVSVGGITMHLKLSYLYMAFFHYSQLLSSWMSYKPSPEHKSSCFPLGHLCVFPKGHRVSCARISYGPGSFLSSNMIINACDVACVSISSSLSKRVKIRRSELVDEWPIWVLGWATYANSAFIRESYSSETNTHPGTSKVKLSSTFVIFAHWWSFINEPT